MMGVLEWDGISWSRLEDDHRYLCTERAYHTTILYGGEVYIMGGFIGENR